MVEFELYGLTPRQKLLADMMWQCPEWADVEQLMKALPPRDRQDCEGIIEMMKMAIVEQCYDGIQDLTKATQVINQAKGR